MAAKNNHWTAPVSGNSIAPLLLYHMQKTVISKPFQLLLFGATGDLASLKLFPALYELYIQRRLPNDFSIIGFGRTQLTQEEFHQVFRKSIEKKYGKEINLQLLEKLLSHLEYFSGQYDSLEDFQKLFNFAQDLSKHYSSGSGPLTKLAYFSVPPNVFEPIIKNLALARSSENEDIKLILEKPFGYDAQSAAVLFQLLSGYFQAEQIYLLDHYLGKRPIQSILKLRMENNVINLLLKGSEIANIQITALEKADVGKRVGYFDQVGLMKDMVQSHLLQILALITMDIPITPSVNSLQREKNNILSAVRFSGNAEDIVFGQYESYQKAEGVQENSSTDTFCALRLFIDRRDWFNVPIYIRTGKKLSESKTSVVIEFKKMPFQNQRAEPNRLIFEFKPEERLRLSLIQDRDDNMNLIGYELDTVELSQSLQCEGDHCLSEYAHLMLDALKERKINFLSFEEILAAWKVIDEVEQVRKSLLAKPEAYEDYSDGPKTYINIPQRDGFEWHR